MRLRDELRLGRADRWPRACAEIDRRNRIELAREDIEAAQLSAAHKKCIELAWLRRAEIPAFSRGPVIRAGLIEQRTEVLHRVGVLVVPQQDWPDTASIRVGPEKDVHVAAADMVVDVAPVGI